MGEIAEASLTLLLLLHGPAALLLLAAATLLSLSAMVGQGDQGEEGKDEAKVLQKRGEVLSEDYFCRIARQKPKD